MSKPLRSFVRARSITEANKRAKSMEKRGWKKVTKEPVLDPANPFSSTPDSYVMVMEHPTLKREGTKTWGYR